MFLGGYSRSQVITAFLAVMAMSVGIFYGAADSPAEKQPEIKDKPKVALIVLDGMEWTPVNRLREKDRVPHLSRAMDEGVYTTFATSRAFSPITWTKIGSGQSTENVSIDGWNVQAPGGQRMIQSQDVENRRIWDYLNDANISTGVVGWMLTWPVEEVKGYMIAGPLSTSDRELVYPREEFMDNYQVIESGDEWEIAHMVLDTRKNETPFITLGFKNLDTYQHQLWKFMVPEKFGLERKEENQKYREVIYTEYENLDEVVGRFGEDWNVIVIGDSGFEAENKEYGNIAPTYENDINPLLAAMNYTDITTKTVRGTEITRVEESSRLKRCPVLYPQNDVLSPTTYLQRICVLDDSVDINETIDRLESVEYRNGKKFFYDLHYVPEKESIKGKMKVYQSGVVNTTVESAMAPQPHVSGKSYYVDKALGLELPNGEPFDLWIGPEKSGDHPPGTDSVFIARGPYIADRGNISRGAVGAEDIAPTLLYLYGLPVPRDMDGAVAKEIFTERFNDERELRYVNASTRESSSEKPYFKQRGNLSSKALKQRLRNLGYAVE